jgi:hypothetical protein
MPSTSTLYAAPSTPKREIARQNGRGAGCCRMRKQGVRSCFACTAAPQQRFLYLNKRCARLLRPAGALGSSKTSSMQRASHARMGCLHARLPTSPPWYNKLLYVLNIVLGSMPGSTNPGRPRSATREPIVMASRHARLPRSRPPHKTLLILSNIVLGRVSGSANAWAAVHFDPRHECLAPSAPRAARGARATS